MRRRALANREDWTCILNLQVSDRDDPKVGYGVVRLLLQQKGPELDPRQNLP